MNGQPASYYTNASNITTGTLPWSQAPTGTANLSASQTFAGNTTFSANVFVTGAQVNAVLYTTGAPLTGTGGIYANVTTLVVGNNTVNTTITSAGLTVNGTAVVANAGGVYTTGTVNALSFTTGATGTGTGGAVVNSSTFFLGNNTVNSTINSTSIYWNGAAIINATGAALLANNATYLNGQLASYYTNASNITTGTLPWSQAPTGTVNTTASQTFTGNNTFQGTNTVVQSNTTFTANVYMSGANLNLTGTAISGSTTDVYFRNGTFSGNLVVSGTVVTVNTSQLVVNDNIIELGYNNTTTDTVDTGWFSPAGNATSVWYSGFARIASKSANNNGYFYLFASNTNPNTAATIDLSTNTSTSTLQAYLLPYGTGGAFVANSSVINITANGTVSSTLTVNSVTLTTALAATSGGTGQTSYTTGDILYASSGTALSKLSVPGSAANGQVLQIVNNLPAYSTIDGGAF